ncbi:acyl-CoA thioesterase [Gulosibacter molinativorax]|uniref:4-hydroxybenzoyl-CoA thioesterase n=1 Tax=Gulosibacter molinativorax TaxID=256821 RepID=A0ABT7C3G1_9MICO|nr:acyl-CoA thioesterase [Gulosibacter molinativorax]MDJ1369800.1 4-hydroxybenzoyl-CoA thioesterase [Gulosibacter molinativorax]
MWLQWILAVFFRSKRLPKLDVTAVSRIRYRVLPTDVDFLLHMNNGRYFSYLDLGRVNLLARTGLDKVLSAQGIYAVVASNTMTYRKSLKLFQAFDIESRFIGTDDRNFYIEQRFVVNDELYARGIIKGRLIKKGVGPLKVPELNEVTGYDWVSWRVDPAIHEWAESVRLPPAKADAPNVWPEPAPTAPRGK